MDTVVGLRPFSEACERNRAPILEKLLELFESPGTVLEIGSGTGQHAVHFARHLPQLSWQCSDLPEQHAGIEAWLAEAQLGNVLAPIALDVTTTQWPVTHFDYVFSANTAHIMNWEAVCAMFEGAGKVLAEGGRFALYGPFNYDGQFTSDSNRQFDAALRGENPDKGLRDRQDIDVLAGLSGLLIDADYPMPSNNRLLVFRKT